MMHGQKNIKLFRVVSLPSRQ